MWPIILLAYYFVDHYQLYYVHTTFSSSSPSSLTVSIPFHIGKRRIINHTLLVCTGGPSDSTQKPHSEAVPSVSVGDIVWAKASQLQAWPARVIHHSKRKLKKPEDDKVGSQGKQGEVSGNW